MDLTHAEWRTASHSSINGGNCVEVAAICPESSPSGTRNREGPGFIFGAADWQAFTTQLKNGMSGQNWAAGSQPAAPAMEPDYALASSHSATSGRPAWRAGWAAGRRWRSARRPVGRVVHHLDLHRVAAPHSYRPVRMNEAFMQCQAR